MEMLSHEYGWTPEEIRQQPVVDIEMYLNIIRVRTRLANKKHGK